MRLQSARIVSLSLPTVIVFNLKTTMQNSDPPAWPTREQWLLTAVEKVTPLFTALGYRVPPCRVSCGFASTGLRSGHIGQCWSRASGADAVNQIFISPALADPIEVIDTLVHELVHAVDDCQHKHGKEFKKIALRLGMQGPMRSAGAGPALKEKLLALANELGPYPHGKLQAPSRKVSRPARPRAKCPECSYQVPMLKKFLAFGPPLCPQHRVEMAPLGDWEG